ncbi:hypothetical protein [Verrucomicrobium spinosum]|uniref:hypothetical protein n=1 Tax=Verrucomicrobium spinosum TaxID=2736 RepID=UPI0009462903|nr:hypothetical protein [Verrucomicrobium spinosum]
MRPISSTILVTLLAAVCGLCTIQWYRESDLRQLGVDLRNETTKLAGANQELENRVKAADGRSSASPPPWASSGRRPFPSRSMRSRRS